MRYKLKIVGVLMAFVVFFVSFHSWAFDQEIKIKPLSNCTGVTYLINTEWGQWYPYNLLCPRNESGTSSFKERLGCWSVAIGQIINYHQLQTNGSVSYNCTHSYINPQHITNNLNDYDYFWPMMADNLTGANQSEIENVSRLLYDIATIIEKDFGTGGYVTIYSNISTLINELVNHVESVTGFTKWDNDLNSSEIISEIDNGRPIMFYTRGHDAHGHSTYHAMVIDGYRYNESGGRQRFEVHINFGWAGAPVHLPSSWYYYYGLIPAIDGIVFDEPGYRKGLLIRLAPRPPSIFGPSSGLVGEGYNFTAMTEYDINPPLYYKFDWGDGTFTDWLGRYNSGEPCIALHTWKTIGVYNIRAKARDASGWESDWSNPLSLSMPKTTENLIYLIFERFFLLLFNAFFTNH